MGRICLPACDPVAWALPSVGAADHPAMARSADVPAVLGRTAHRRPSAEDLEEDGSGYPAKTGKHVNPCMWSRTVRFLGF
jgi:hypothetical protein